MDTCHSQLSSPFSLGLLLGPQRCTQPLGRAPEEEFRELQWCAGGMVGTSWGRAERRTSTSTRQRQCLSPEHASKAQSCAAMNGGCLFCTVGLTSSFIAHTSIQISLAVFAQAAIADQHPSPAPFPGPWGTGHCPHEQGKGPPTAPSAEPSTCGLVRTSVSSLTATSQFLVS